MSGARHWWRVTVEVDGRRHGVPDRGWGWLEAHAVDDVRRKWAKRGELVLGLEVTARVCPPREHTHRGADGARLEGLVPTGQVLDVARVHRWTPEEARALVELVRGR